MPERVMALRLYTWMKREMPRLLARAEGDKVRAPPGMFLKPFSQMKATRPRATDVPADFVGSGINIRNAGMTLSQLYLQII